MTSISSQLILTASWRIMSELYRRFPGKFRIVQTHPGGGLYDCLSLYQENDRITLDNLKHIADFNRNGSFHIFHRFDGRNPGDPIDLWSSMVAANNMKIVLDQVTEEIGLFAPSSLPSSTPTTLVYRFISATLTSAVFGKDRWNCENGFFDSSQGSEVLEGAFKLFPGAYERIKVSIESDFLGQSAYRFWFITRNHKPIFCLETMGNLWAIDGKHYQLMSTYIESKRHLWQMVGSIAGNWLK